MTTSIMLVVDQHRCITSTTAQEIFVYKIVPDLLEIPKYTFVYICNKHSDVCSLLHTSLACSICIYIQYMHIHKKSLYLVIHIEIV